MSLGLLILLHEFGHYITARMFKIRVEKFYLFFDFLFPLPGVLNFSLFKKKVGDTEYGIGWFPMGGYVSIAGMIDENLNTEQMNAPAEPWEFRSKPAWQRLIVMLGGIIVNVLLAFLIYAMVLFAWGEKKVPMSSIKNGIECSDSLGMAVGFRTGDQIVSVDGKTIEYYDDLRADILLGHTVLVNRNGQQVTINLPQDFIDKIARTENLGFISVRKPAIFKAFTDSSVNVGKNLAEGDRIVAVNDSIRTDYFDEFQQALARHKGETVTVTALRQNKPVKEQLMVSAAGKIGAEFGIKNVDDLEKYGVVAFERKQFGFFESFPAGVRLTFQKLDFYVKQFKLIFSPGTGAYKHLGGFKSMAKMFDGVWDWEAFWNRTAFISIVLAFMNLLPIPALDGGHVVFTLYEMITRRKPSVKFLTYAQYAGMAFLLFLMVYANLNDFFKFFR